jgi:hypothetical protein
MVTSSRGERPLSPAGANATKTSWRVLSGPAIGTGDSAKEAGDVVFGAGDSVVMPLGYRAKVLLRALHRR